MRKIIFYTVFIFCLCANNLVLAQSNAAGKNKISLDIKGMDIVDVLKMLSTRSSMNLVLGKNVTGRVTLFLKDVEVMDAFEIVLLANDLAYEKSGEIINVMTQRDYELQHGERYKDKKEAKVVVLKYAKAADISRSLNQIKTSIGRIVADDGTNTLVLIDSPEKIKEMENFIQSVDLPIETRVFNLNYALAEKINTKLQEIVTKGIGMIKIDERTNKIAVTDYPKKLDEIAKIISAFDEKTPQVLIDAQIIEIKPSDKFEMGVDWDFFIKNNFRISAALPISSSGKLSLGTASTTPSGPGDFKTILNVLRTIGDTKILSSPRIMALNNQEAKILVGTKDAYITSTTSQGGTGTTVTSQSVNFVDVGIKLYVTPTINREGFVTMKIKPEISSAERTNITSEGQVTQIPIVTTSESETTVMVRDGITIIIGGLRKDQKTKAVTKIPILGDIPLLGALFRNTSDEVIRTELVILLTPHIMTGEDSFTDFAEIKPVEGGVVKLSKGEIVIDKISRAKTEQVWKENLSQYQRLIVDKIKSVALFTKPKGEFGLVQIYFGLDSKGRLIDEPRIVSSTNRNLDNASITSIKNASPFNPFPKELGKQEESFQVALEYK